MNETALKRWIWIAGLFPLGSLAIAFGTLDLSIVIPVQMLFLVFPILANTILLVAGFVLNQRGIKGWAFVGLLMSSFLVIILIAGSNDIGMRGALSIIGPIILGVGVFGSDCIALGFLARRTGGNRLFAWSIIAAIRALIGVAASLLWFDLAGSVIFIILLAPRKKKIEWAPRGLSKGRRRILAIATAVGVAAAGLVPYLLIGTIGDLDQRWFIESDFVELGKIGNISRFRSHAGHEYVDSYEGGERSMKHYFQPLTPYANSSCSIKVYAPANAIVSNIGWERSSPYPGELRGIHVDLTPISDPFYRITIFHVNLTTGLFLGALVTAGQFLGYADTRNTNDFDIAIALLLPFGMQRDVSYFAVMDDGVFLNYQARGITTRDQAVIPRATSDAADGMEMPLSWDWITLT